MTWGRVDDHADDDPRWWGMPLAAAGLYWMALPYCLRTDENLIPAAMLRRLCHPAQEDPKVQPLLDAGLWVELPGGYGYDPDDWTRMHMPEEKRREISEKRALAGSNGAAKRWQRNGKPMASDSNGCPVPVPVPVPSSSIEVPNGTSHLSDERSGIARRVFAEWQRVWDHPTAKLTPKRLALVVARLREKFTEETLLLVPRGARADPWAERVLHHEFELLFRDAGHVERFARFATEGPPAVAQKPLPMNPNDRRIHEFGRSPLEVLA